MRLTASVADVATAGAPVGISSPATSESLVSSDVAGAFGITLDTATITRREAMTVPAVKRGRNVIAGTIGTLPLVAGRLDDTGAGDQITRRLLEQPDPNTTRSHVITWTVDDLIFYGVGMWRVIGRDATNFPVAAERLSRERWQIRRHGDGWAVFVDGSNIPTPNRDLIRFDGPDEGVLLTGVRTLRTAIRLEDAVNNFARLDVPLGSLEPMEGAEPLDDTAGSSPTTDDPDRSEVDALLDGWELARARRSTAYLRNVKYVTHQLDARQLQLDEARRTSDGRVAQLLNLDARYVNAPTGDSLTYATAEGNRRDLVDLSLAIYLAAIADRLSMGDVTPRGQLVRFDLAAFLRGDLAGVIAAKAAGLTDAAEGRHWLGLRPRTDLPEPAPAPEAPTP